MMTGYLFLTFQKFWKILKKHKFALISETVSDRAKRTKILGSHGLSMLTANIFISENIKLRLSQKWSDMERNGRILEIHGLSMNTVEHFF